MHQGLVRMRRAHAGVNPLRDISTALAGSTSASPSPSPSPTSTGASLSKAHQEAARTDESRTSEATSGESRTSESGSSTASQTASRETARSSSSSSSERPSSSSEEASRSSATQASASESSASESSAAARSQSSSSAAASSESARSRSREEAAEASTRSASEQSSATQDSERTSSSAAPRSTSEVPSSAAPSDSTSYMVVTSNQSPSTVDLSVTSHPSAGAGSGSGHEKTLDTGAIAGIAVGCAIAAIVACALVWLAFFRKRRSNQPVIDFSPNHIDSWEPNLGEDVDRWAPTIHADDHDDWAPVIASKHDDEWYNGPSKSTSDLSVTSRGAVPPNPANARSNPDMAAAFQNPVAYGYGAPAPGVARAKSSGSMAYGGYSQDAYEAYPADKSNSTFVTNKDLPAGPDYGVYSYGSGPSAYTVPVQAAPAHAQAAPANTGEHETLQKGSNWDPSTLAYEPYYQQLAKRMQSD